LKKSLIKKILLSTCISFSLILSSSCSNKSSANKIELWTMQLKPTFEVYMNDLITSYKKENPSIEIEWVDLPAKEIEQKALTSIAGGKSPDIINLNPEFSSQLAELDTLANLDEYVSKDVKDKYFKNIWDASSFNKKTYGFPWYLSTSVVIYNKEIFKQAGLKEAPKTFDDLMTMGEVIKKKTGKYIYMPNFGDSGKILELMAQEGIEIISKDNKKAMFNTPDAEKFINFWIDLSKKGIIPQNSITQGHREAIDKFQAGEVSMLLSGAQFLNIIKENAPQLYPKVDISSQITGKSKKLSVKVMNLVIPKSSKNIEQSVKFAEYITNADNQLKFSKIVTILPSIIKSSKDEYFTKLSANPTLDERARKLSAEQLKDSVVLLPNPKKWIELRKNFDQYFQQAYLGQITAKDALKKAEDDWNQILNSN